MKRSHLWILTALLLVSCGGDDGAGPVDDGNNNPPVPVPTTPGVPNGAPTVGTIGAAGGSLSSSDGLFTLEVPPGALSTDTDITIQPLTNTAWGGVGNGYRLTPDGLTFAVPAALEFSLEDSLLAGSDTAYVDVAVQLANGVWGVLKHRSLDWDARTLTCTTTHFSDYSMIEGVQIRPTAAQVYVNRSLPLTVQYCSRAVSGDPDLASLIISCDPELAPVGSFDDWSVNGAVGGNGTVGTVSPTTGPGVVYTAPALAPNANPVAVSVRTRFEGNTALLVAHIVIVDADTWEGEITVKDASGNEVTSFITWTYVGGFGTEKFFGPSGPVLYTLGPGDCAFVSLTPNTHFFDSNDGLMTIDYGVDPPSVVVGIGTFWDAEHCYQCPEHPVQCADIGLGAAFYFVDEVIGTDLNLIAASELPVGSDIYTYSFTKVIPPAPMRAGR